MGFLFVTSTVSTYLERPDALTLRAGGRLHFVVLRLNEGSEHVRALVTVVFDDGQLRQDSGGARHDSMGTHQLVQMQLTMDMKRIVQGLTIVSIGRILRRSLETEFH